MGSPRIGPPPPVRVAAATSAGAHSAAEHPPVSKAEKTTLWTSLVRGAEIRSRHFQEIARLHFAHMRLVAYTEGSRLRHSLVLRVARPDHAVLHSEGRRRVIRR
jgi:allantoicase